MESAKIKQCLAQGKATFYRKLQKATERAKMSDDAKIASLGKDRDEEIRKNYEAFKKMLPKLLKEYRNQHALLRGEKLIAVYSTALDAERTGKLLYDDDIFSVQEITDVPVDLGFYSHVVPVG